MNSQRTEIFKFKIIIFCIEYICLGNKIRNADESSDCNQLYINSSTSSGYLEDSIS